MEEEIQTKNSQPKQDTQKTEKNTQIKKGQPGLNDIKLEILLIEKIVQSKDLRQFTKNSKKVRKFKKHLKSHHFLRIFEALPVVQDVSYLAQFQDFNQNFDQILEISAQNKDKLMKTLEVQIFLKILFLIYLVQVKSQTSLKHAVSLADDLFKQINENRKKHLEQLESLIYFYHSRVYELIGKLKNIRGLLYDAYRQACLNKDEIGQATLINLLLRNLILYKNYEAAQQLVKLTNFPESKSNNEYVRYLYYTGRIKAIQLDYQESYSRLVQAIRKSPEHTALGFRVQAQKLALIVGLLLGEIPNRSLFAQEELKNPLYPYYKLVYAVINGNINEFQNIIKQYEKLFIKDDLLSLIQRLYHNVINIGLKRINLSYSRISFADVSEKLQLNPQDIEFIIAKAIRDGVINAKLDHQNKCIIMKENKDIYSSELPQQAFATRIDYCLNLYNQATKALQYPAQKVKYDTKDEIEEMTTEELEKMLKEMDEDYI